MKIFILLSVIYACSSHPVEEEQPDSKKGHHIGISWRNQSSSHPVEEEQPDSKKGHHIGISWRNQTLNEGPGGQDQGPGGKKKHHVGISWGRRALNEGPGDQDQGPGGKKKHHVGISWGRRGPAHGSQDHETYIESDSSRPIELQCQVYDVEPKDVQRYIWEKDGAEIDQNNQQLSKSADNSTLFVKQVEQNAGTYQCLLATSIGVASSQKVDIVNPKIDLPETLQKSLNPVEGAPFGLPCDIPKGTPQPLVHWVKKSVSNPENKERFLNRRILQAPDGALYFSNATQEDLTVDFKYVCEVTSPALREPKELVVYNVDKFSSGEAKKELVPQYLSEDVIGVVDEKTELYCIYGGTPLAHPDWFKDGQDVNGDPKDRVTRYNRSSGRRLLIKRTIASDAGQYTCAVNNGVAEANHTINLVVEAFPTLTKKPDLHTTATLGQDLTLPCEAQGTPTPTKSWIYNGKPLVQNDRLTVTDSGLTVKNYQDSDKGYYGCLASNKYGDDYVETAVNSA